MKVLPHEHPLTLIDLNPKYPHDEEVYDDEEDLIIKQAFQSPCGRCNQEITYLDRYYYKCDHCDYNVHKLCAELPTTLEHASHSAHTLTLFLDESHGACHVCKNIPWYKQLRYYCSRCMFIICLDCGMNRVQYHTLYHPSHEHPLVPMCREILAKCDACGEEHKGAFYQCVICLRSFIHEDCVSSPKRLLIQEGTGGRFFHTHPLILTYSFPFEYQKAKFNPMCRVCDNSFHNENLWVYKCEKCRYYVHLECAHRIEGPSNSDPPEGDPDTLHLPLADQTYNIITNFLSKESNAVSITHESHKHPLILVDTRSSDDTMQKNKVEYTCDGCVTLIMDMPFYKCTHGCNFVLHEWCTRLPAKLEGHKRYPRHTLTLLPKVDDWFNLFKCYDCDKACNGFAYHCNKCNRYIDVFCALVSKGIIHKSHPYHPLSKTQRRSNKDYCRICLCGFKYRTETSLSCNDCSFHLHPECALLLPETIKHRYDKHPMTLTYSPVEDHEGDYFCEVCEEELNPNASFYHCHECRQSMHTTCAPLIPQSKPYLFYGSRSKGHVSEHRNIKLGITYKTRDHRHPLSFLLGTESDGNCTACGKDLKNKVMLKCAPCKFAFHSFCLLNDDDDDDD